MLKKSPIQSPQSSFFDIFSQLDLNHPLLALSKEINWSKLEEVFSPLYSNLGRAAKPIRLMSGLLILKQMYNLSDEKIIEQWNMNPYFQIFCGEKTFQTEVPCHSTELIKFRNRIGEKGANQIFALSVELHGKSAEENTVIVDTTVQEKAITYPTDTKLAIKIINRLNKLAKKEKIKQRRTYSKEVKELRLACRHFRHVKIRSKAKKALKLLRTRAGRLIRELERELPKAALVREEENFNLYKKVLSQKPKDKNKIYSLHEPEVYCVSKGKDHKAYEYGKKASVVTTLKSQVIIGVASHDEHVHDSKTLKSALISAHDHRKKEIKLAVVDRGYRGSQKFVDCEVLIPGKPLKRDSEYRKSKKRVLCRKRSSIEPIIGHLKQNYRLQRNWLKGNSGDRINLLMAACAWNMRKWILAFFLFEFCGNLYAVFIFYNKKINT